MKNKVILVNAVRRILEIFDDIAVILQSEVEKNSPKSPGARAPVPHSWRRQCCFWFKMYLHVNVQILVIQNKICVIHVVYRTGLHAGLTCIGITKV